MSSLCAFIGVGFISGAEIWFYFARFGWGMFFGLVIFSILMFLMIMQAISAPKSTNKLAIKTEFIILLVSEILISAAMISGLQETAKTLFGNFWFLIFLISVFVIFLILCLGFNSFSFYNYFVTGFIVLIFVCLFLFSAPSFDFGSIKTNVFSPFNALFFAVFYVFMNIAEVRPILTQFDKNRHKIKKFLFVFLFVFVIDFLLFLSSGFLIKNQNLVNFSMPFLILFHNFGGLCETLFLAGLVMALVSTEISCLFGAAGKLDHYFHDTKFSKACAMLLALIFGTIKFSFFVRVVYPLVAVLNIILFFVQKWKK